MLDPKKVAQTIGQLLFKTEEERRQEAEQKRDIEVRMGKVRIKRHISKQQGMAQRLKGLAKRALALNDEARFRQVGRQLLNAQQDVQRWERYLLSLDILEARRDQVKLSVDLIQSVKAMGESLSELAGPQNIAELQTLLETSLAKASSIEEQIEVMMNVMDSTLSADLPVEDEALARLESALAQEVAGEEAARFDPEIEAGLKKIREELGREEK